MLRLLRYLLLLAVVVLAAGLYWFPKAVGIDGWTQQAKPLDMRAVSDERIRKLFSEPDQPVAARAYEDAFRYLFEGHLAYRTPQGAFVHYAGAHSLNGRTVDGIEGFARFFPIAGAWLAGGRSDEIDLGDRKVSVSATLKQGLLAGTRRDGPEYWGPIESQTQRLVESSDIALGLWLTRKHIWEKLEPAEKQQVTRWLMKALDVDTWPGNWQLFPVTVHTVLKALGVDTCCHTPIVAKLYSQFKAQQYKGDGWFYDPPNGFDYYNAWSIHYSLFWLDQIDPQFDPQYIREVHKQFVAFYKHLMSPRGVPMMGRSLCYRMSTPVPLLTAQVLAPEEVSPGMAMRALDAVWGHFVGHGGLSHGTITQGYCGKDLSILNEYSGPASCLWGARGLLLALYLDNRFKLFDGKREPLLVERGDYRVESATAKWVATGKRAEGEVVLTLTENAADYQRPIQRYGLKQRALEALMNTPRRPNNRDPLYLTREFSSHRPIMGCQNGH